MERIPERIFAKNVAAVVLTNPREALGGVFLSGPRFLAGKSSYFWPLPIKIPNLRQRQKQRLVGSMLYEAHKEGGGQAVRDQKNGGGGTTRFIRDHPNVAVATTTNSSRSRERDGGGN